MPYFTRIIYHLENAEMTTELQDDLINFSFENLHDVFEKFKTQAPRIAYMRFYFVPCFLECLGKLVCHHSPSCLLYIQLFMLQPLSEANHICQTFQVHFDRMLCDVLEKYHSFPGFILLLGGLCQYMEAKEQYTLGAGMVASLYLIWQSGNGHILDDTGLCGAHEISFDSEDIYLLPYADEFFNYLTKFLKNPKRSGTCFFGQQRYVMASKECLQLYLCSHRNFSEAATQFTLHDQTLRRSKPLRWVARLGVHSRIWKARHHFKVQQLNSVTVQDICQEDSYPEHSPEHQYLRSLLYRWALDLLPLFLERSAISLELADVLRCCTFTTMAWKFPQRRRLAKEAIVKYLLRVESLVDEA